jgi:hypothetical protein
LTNPVTGTLGSSSSCKSADQWTSYAKTVCDKSGKGALTMTTFRTSCGTDRYRYVDYTCGEPCPQLPA